LRNEDFGLRIDEGVACFNLFLIRIPKSAFLTKPFPPAQRNRNGPDSPSS
jgi:hypothetical protein